MKNDRPVCRCWFSFIKRGIKAKNSPSSTLTCLVLVIALTLLINQPCLSQQRWQRNYGGTGHDYGFSVQQTSDGGYIVAGSTYSFGDGEQVYLVKTNASGDTLWTRTYGGAGDDGCRSVQQTPDGGYVLAGWTSSFGNSYQVYLVKTNASGDTLWTRTYGGTGDDAGWAVQQTSDGGYIVTGWTQSFGNLDQVYLIKTNASGDSLWTRTYGGTNNDGGYSVQQTSDGGYIVAGTYDYFGSNTQVYLIKTNASGDTLWTRTHGGTNVDQGYSVQQTQDTGYIVAGYTLSFGNATQVWLLKTNASGDTLWTRNYGGTDNDVGQAVQQTSDGGFIVMGYTQSFGNANQVYLIKTNASGDTLWTRTYGGTGGDYGSSVQQSLDGGYIIAGYTYSFGNGAQVYLVKTDANGSSGVEETAGIRDQGLGISLNVKPNPFTSFASIPGHEAERFNLYDIAGRRVGTYRGDRVGANLPAGVYFLRATGETSTPVRIVKVR